MRLWLLGSRTFCRRFFNRRWRRDFFSSRRRCLYRWRYFYRSLCFYGWLNMLSRRRLRSRFLNRF